MLEQAGADEHAADDTDDPKKEQDANEVVKIDGVHVGVGLKCWDGRRACHPPSWEAGERMGDGRWHGYFLSRMNLDQWMVSTKGAMMLSKRSLPRM